MTKPKAVLAKIVPPESRGDEPTRAQGTRVFVGEQELSGVFRVELVAEAGGIWRARIDAHVIPPATLQAEALVHHPGPWKRFKRWLKTI